MAYIFNLIFFHLKIKIRQNGVKNRKLYKSEKGLRVNISNLRDEEYRTVQQVNK